MRSRGAHLAVLAAGWVVLAVACTGTTPVAVTPATSPVVAPWSGGVVADGTCTITGRIPDLREIELEHRPGAGSAVYHDGRIVQSIDDFSVTELDHDEQGRLVRLRSGELRKEYGPEGLPVVFEFTYAGGAGEPRVETWFAELHEVCTVRPGELICEGRLAGSRSGYTQRETYDREGRWIRRASEKAGHRVEVRRHDDARRTMVETIDMEGDGRIDREHSIVRDAHGRIVRRTSREFGPDGPRVTFTLDIVYTLDPHGRVKCKRMTNTGKYPAVDERCFEYDERNNVIREARTGGRAMTMRYEGDFAGVRCGEPTPPPRDDDGDEPLWSRVRREQLRSLMRQGS